MAVILIAIVCAVTGTGVMGRGKEIYALMQMSAVQSAVFVRDATEVRFISASKDNDSFIE